MTVGITATMTLLNGEAAPHTRNARASRGPVDHHAATASPGTGGVSVTALKAAELTCGARARVGEKQERESSTRG